MSSASTVDEGRRPIKRALISVYDKTSLVELGQGLAAAGVEIVSTGTTAAVLAEFFGTDRVRFTTASDGLPGVTRSFASFTDAATEAGLSRIYGGIHWSFDNTAGQMSGRKIGEYVARNFFGPAAR